jgi:hypothetical protein
MKASARKRRRRNRNMHFGVANVELTTPELRGTGLNAAGQAGDIQGLSRSETFDSQSVEELLEEGQAFEAEAISGVENALDPDESEVLTQEFPEDDVPAEYLENETFIPAQANFNKKPTRRAAP